MRSPLADAYPKLLCRGLGRREQRVFAEAIGAGRAAKAEAYEHDQGC